MVASPCKNCPRRDEPKDQCLKNCHLLQSLQGQHVRHFHPIVASAIDYAEENRFTISYAWEGGVAYS